MLNKLKDWAAHMMRDVVALYFAMGDPRVPWYAKAVAVFVVGYALSPIDLIPDFIPVIGYLDDLILVPIGIWVLLKLIPHDIMEEMRARAEEETVEADLPRNMVAALVIILIWGVLVYALYQSVGPRLPSDLTA